MDYTHLRDFIPLKLKRIYVKQENKFSFLNILVKYDSTFYINKRRLLYKESLWTIYYTSSVFFVSFPNTKTDIIVGTGEKMNTGSLLKPAYGLIV